MHAVQFSTTLCLCLISFKGVCMACWQGSGEDHRDHLVGHLPSLASHVRRDVKELTPAVLRDIMSLQSLTVRLRPSHVTALHCCPC